MTIQETTSRLPGSSSLPQEKRQQARPKRGPLRLIWLGFSGLLLAAALGLATAAVVLPTVTGAQSYTVLTRSMEPKYPPGTFLVVREVDEQQLKVGDVITYQLKSGKPEVVTHRIISTQATPGGERRFITQGDNNGAADPEPVRFAQIRGALWYPIPYLGWITGIRGQSQSSVWIPVLAGLIFAYAAYMFVSGFRDRRKQTSQTSESSEDPTSSADSPVCG